MWKKPDILRINNLCGCSLFMCVSDVSKENALVGVCFIELVWKTFCWEKAGSPTLEWITVTRKRCGTEVRSNRLYCYDNFFLFWQLYWEKWSHCLHVRRNMSNMKEKFNLPHYKWKSAIYLNQHKSYFYSYQSMWPQI